MSFREPAITSLFQISFLIPPDQIPGRLGLLITLSLCMFNTLNSVSRSAPRTNKSPTAMVKWILGCLLFILLACLEFAWILHGMYHTKKVDVKHDMKVNRAHTLDKLMLIIFPVCFIVFTAIFWTSLFNSKY